jgi:hypothetical protein
MTKIDMDSTNHVFIKTNLVTISSPKGMYDSFKCEKCGLRGKSYQIGIITVDGRQRSKANNCPESKNLQKIKITICRAVGRQFLNLTPGSVHDVIAPPQGQNNDRGIWVMGVGEPVKVLFGEFVDVE